MDVPIKHVIGTVALIGLIIGVGLAYTIFTSSVEADIIKQQLKQVAGNVALNLIEIANLIDFANYAQTNFPMAKVLNIPEDLSGRAYAIQLVNETSQGRGYSVHAFLVAANTTSADAPITLNSTQTRLVIATEFVAELPVRGETTNILCSNIAYAGPTQNPDGTRNMVVWGWTGLGFPMVGIGVWRTEG